MISVLCPTYGRPELLEELIESFLRQTYTDSELIVLNDRADQTLVYDHPRVRMINVTTRFPFTGTKRKNLTTFANGSHIAHWDDDDIYLPDHLGNVMQRFPLFNGRNARQKWHWFDRGHAKYRIIPAAYIHTWVGELSLYNEVGGHDNSSQSEDLLFLKKLIRSHDIVGPRTKGFERPTFILRDATGRAHMSYGFQGRYESAAIMDRMEKEVDSIGAKGVFHMKPHWKQDYIGKAQASWEALT